MAKKLSDEAVPALVAALVVLGVAAWSLTARERGPALAEWLRIVAI